MNVEYEMSALEDESVSKGDKSEPKITANASLSDYWISLVLWVIPLIASSAWLFLPLTPPSDPSMPSVYLFIAPYYAMYGFFTALTAIVTLELALPSLLSRLSSFLSALFATAVGTGLLALYLLTSDNLDNVLLVVSSCPIIAGLALFAVWFCVGFLLKSDRKFRFHGSLWLSMWAVFQRHSKDDFVSRAASKSRRASELPRPQAPSSESGPVSRSSSSPTLTDSDLLGVDFLRALFIMSGFLILFYFCQVYSFVYLRFFTDNVSQVVAATAFPVFMYALGWPLLWVSGVIDDDVVDKRGRYLVQPSVSFFLEMLSQVFYRSLFFGVDSIEVVVLVSILRLLQDMFIYLAQPTLRVMAIKTRIFQFFRSNYQPPTLDRLRWSLSADYYAVCMSQRISITAYALFLLITRSSANRQMYEAGEIGQAAFENLLIYLCVMLGVEWISNTIITIALRIVHKHDVIGVGTSYFRSHRLPALALTLLAIHSIQDSIIATYKYELF